MFRIIKDNLKKVLLNVWGYELVRPEFNGHPSIFHFNILLNIMKKREIYSKEEWLFLEYCAENVEHTKSQRFQDLFVLYELGGLRGGYFVEFGAANGEEISNSVLLEKEYGWSGLLAEPAKCWHQKLRQNRSAKIDTRCVWKESGIQLEFHQNNVAEFSTLNDYSDKSTIEFRNLGSKYLVETISLNDLLSDNDAPHKIDFMSIDTEGSEWEILSNFDFEKYDIRIIIVEHNFIEDNRRRIYDRLSKVGFIRVFENISGWDDWFVRRNA